MREDADRWDERHGNADVVAPRAPSAIARDLELDALVPTVGCGLDLACGTGATALWMAQRGLRVTAIDVSALAIELVDAGAVRLGVDDRVDARTVDLDDGIPDDLVDLDLITCERFRDVRLYGTIIERLRPGGLAIVTVLSVVGCEDPGPFHALGGELATAFATEDTDVLLDFERDGSASVIVRRR